MKRLAYLTFYGVAFGRAQTDLQLHKTRRSGWLGRLLFFRRWYCEYCGRCGREGCETRTKALVVWEVTIPPEKRAAHLADDRHLFTDTEAHEVLSLAEVEPAPKPIRGVFAVPHQRRPQPYPMERVAA
jgi:hypothetical protein